MTPVLMEFVTPTGDPLPLASVDIQLTRATFDEDDDNGIIMPRLVQAKTDAEGKVTVELMPSDELYHVTAYDPVSDAGLHYHILVPEVVNGLTVRMQDIIVQGKLPEKDYDEAALETINTNKAVVLSVRSELTGMMEATQEAMRVLPVTQPTPPVNPAVNAEWINSANGRQYIWLVESGHGSWVEMYTAVIVNIDTADTGGTAGPTFDPADTPVVTTVSNPSTSTVLIEEGGATKRIAVQQLLTSVGTEVSALGSIVDTAGTDKLMLLQGDGVLRTITLNQLIALTKL